MGFGLLIPRIVLETVIWILLKLEEMPDELINNYVDDIWVDTTDNQELLRPDLYHCGLDIK